MSERDRAVSEVLGYALIFSIILVSIGIVSVGGLSALQETRDAEQLDNAERAMSVLADNTEDIYARDAPSRATELSVGSASLSLGENVTVNATVHAGGTRTTHSYTLRPVVFRSGTTRIVYEGGAIFRDQPDGGSILRDPPFVFTGAPRQQLVVVQTAGPSQSVAGSAVLARMKATQRDVAFEDNTSSPAFLNITSPRAELWERYLADQNGITGCAVGGPDGQSLECELAGPRLTVVRHRMRVGLNP